MTLQHSVHGAHVPLMSSCAGFERKLAEWHTILDQLEIPDGAVAGLSASDKPVLRGKLLQLPAADRPWFFVGQPLDVLKTLRTLLPDAPLGRSQHFFNMILLRGLLQYPCATTWLSFTVHVCEVAESNWVFNCYSRACTFNDLDK